MSRGGLDRPSTMRTANDQLRAARQRTASPTHAGECLSRQELAELVNRHAAIGEVAALRQRITAAVVGV